MEKSNNTILDAGITPAEFDDLFAGDISLDDYLAEYPKQSWRYGHLADLALLRGDSGLADYFRKKSGAPEMVDRCD